MKRFISVLGLMLFALFHQGCGTAAAPAAPGAAAVNHNYPFSGTFGNGPNTGNGQFHGPIGIAVHNGAIFVSDSLNNRVQKFDLSGNFLAAYPGGAGGFTAPRGIAFDSIGIMYVADSGNNRIQKLDLNGNYITSFGASGTAAGSFMETDGLAFDSSDRIYITERNNNRFQRCTNAGGSCVTVGGTAIGITNGTFDQPLGISVDKNGNVWVTDTYNSRIQEFNSSLAFQQAFGIFGTGNGQFEYPTDIRMDLDGNLIVADYSNNRVQKVSASGSFIQLIGTGWASPVGLAIDPNNNLYVTDATQDTVSIFTPN